MPGAHAAIRCVPFSSDALRWFVQAAAPPSRKPIGNPRLSPDNRWVIHAVGPHYGLDPDPPTLLARAVGNCLRLADGHDVTCIALPAISTGIQGYPIEEAGPRLIRTTRAYADRTQHLQEIRYVLLSTDALRWFV